MNTDNNINNMDNNNLADTQKSILECLSFIPATEVPVGMFDSEDEIRRHIADNDMTYYLDFLEKLYPYLNTDNYSEGMKAVLSEMERGLNTENGGTVLDHAMLFDYQAAYEYHGNHNLSQALDLQKKAVSYLTNIDEESAMLASNIYANLGALYRLNKEMEPAVLYMKRGIDILNQYHLIFTGSGIAQLCNYAALLHDIGESETALSILQKFASVMEQHRDTDNPNYAALQRTMEQIKKRIS